MVKKHTKPTSIQVKDKKASFDYHLSEHIVAGMVLRGSQIKSIRMGKLHLTDGYCYFRQGELWVKGVHIGAYQPAGPDAHPLTEPRKLLLHRRELKKLFRKQQEKGFTIVPTRFFLNDRGWAKLEIALAKGKKKYDKRATLKERDIQRRLERV